MTKKTLVKLAIIFIIGFLLRIWFIDKPEGLWNDEYVSWNIATQNNFKDFFSLIFSNCHTPLYYFYLKLHMFLFSDSDLSLRFSSVIPSMISIIIMFFVGREIKSEKLGLLCAFFTAISSFNIYYAQEARLYSLVFLFTAITILFFIKAIKEPSKTNLITFFVCHGLICATHTLGIIFSFFNIGLLLYYFRKKKTQINLYYIAPFIVIFLLISPLLFIIATSKNLSQFWSEFSLTKIICTFIDYYSPVLLNLQNTFSSFSKYLYTNNHLNYGIILFSLIPLSIGLVGLIKVIFNKDKIINLLLISSALFYLTLIILSFMGKMILMTKYSIEIYPIIILASCYGLGSFKSKYIKNLLLFIFIFINLFYLIYSPASAPKKNRPEGNKLVVNLLRNSSLNNNDYVLLTYYPVEKYERYLSEDDIYKFYSINKFNFNYALFNGDNYFEVIKKGKERYKNFFIKNNSIENYIDTNILSNMKKGDKFGIMVLKSVAFISEDNMENILANDKEYKKTPFIFLVFSKLKNDSIKILDNKLVKVEELTSGDWILYVYQKN